MPHAGDDDAAVAPPPAGQPAPAPDSGWGPARDPGAGPSLHHAAPPTAGSVPSPAERPEPETPETPVAFDVGTVAPRGGHIAKQCPLRVQYELYPPAGIAPAQPSDVEQLRAGSASDFRSEILGMIRAVDGLEVSVVDPSRPPALRMAETLLAMGQGAPVVVGGRLPDDVLGRRAGAPDLLVRAERRPDGRWAYHPVSVRKHRTLDTGEPREPAQGARVSPLDAPGLAAAVVVLDRSARSHQGDRFLLAHHHRMLEQTCHGSVDAVGGVIGTERQVVWHQLDEPVKQHRWDQPHVTVESTLARYDLEFTFRLVVLAAAASGSSIVGPVAVGECSSCPWRPHCWPRIVEADSTSLLPGFGYRQWYNLARCGIATRQQVAELDLPTAEVRDALEGLADLAALVAEARPLAERRPHAPVAELEAATPEATAVLAERHISTVTDLLTLDPEVVAIADQPIRHLAEAVQGARAQATGVPQLRHGLDQLTIPTADIEIDIDMESALDGTTYLWGAWAHGRYHAFSSWEVPSPATEAAVFSEFWAWLSGQRRTAADEGLSVAVYCWFQGAEAKALRRGAKAAAAELGAERALDEVEELLTSVDFVDLYEVFTRQLVTGGSAGLKVVATSAGFAWRDADPNGADSMAWHAQAVNHEDADLRDQARARLLAYNEDDVRATVSVRHWMRTELGGENLPLAEYTG